MRLSFAAPAVASVVLTAALAWVPTAHAEDSTPYVDHVEWAKWGDLSSLRVYPTASARELSRQPGGAALADEAWRQVLALSPDADIAGMREQFVCHWTFAELVEPGKTSWNLEPWRPEVSPEEMAATGCNPGGTEEPF
ncbi:DUF2599 domain-containing protein [Mycolicibacterium smegmatis]|uniref:Uncharacterized protein n=1 Tax=Mycolicibacterium smegmatis (strain MKD8) TaxID=1214915 RepID=A0A2U9PJR7_MYCSE|nr:DUF2599 domain-containing protein [Mycolicibacterium smegmatis]AWT51971.1 hypothetical protein D806_009820 [Mycolicibacterium smegmatis MKD8]MDF1898873.1 DUF2599 domain-containing protein [Mycolicibacterium smegmatis]MDF1904697.1 DUF2599 domain-containing protein [Mycolicibacterium smegmatis]MDF1918566.1 DUF2599 domain-containing protein [Mycolicibacterium smegmatis]MDF1923861.1 DUF2599 domain-containing protein [Mycolicibacterium smegmatis]